jgi:hypothetical protein
MFATAEGDGSVVWRNFHGSICSRSVKNSILSRFNFIHHEANKKQESPSSLVT